MDQRRETDRIIYKLVQQFDDFREADANWKIRFEKSSTDFREGITLDVNTLKGNVAKLMVPYRLLTWIGSIVGAEISIKYCGTFFGWLKDRLH